MAKDYIINGRKVKMWYTRGGARIPIYEDGGVGKNQNKKLLSNKELSNMAWDEVVQKNTDYYNEKSIYDFEGIKKGKYAYEEGWRDNKASGVIKQEDLDKLATRDEWLSANKYKKVYNSVKEATEDPSSKINKYIERKTGKNPARKALGRGLEDLGDKDIRDYFKKEMNDYETNDKRYYNKETKRMVNQKNKSIKELVNEYREKGLIVDEEKPKNKKALGRGLEDLKKENKVKDNTLDKIFGDNNSKEIKDKVSKYKKRKK